MADEIDWALEAAMLAAEQGKSTHSTNDIPYPDRDSKIHVKAETSTPHERLSRDPRTLPLAHTV